MIKILSTKSKNFEKKLNYFLNLRKDFPESKLSIVKKIIKDIQTNKDKSIIKYEKKFNHLKRFKNKNFSFSALEIENYIKRLDTIVK